MIRSHLVLNFTWLNIFINWLIKCFIYFVSSSISTSVTRTVSYKYCFIIILLFGGNNFCNDPTIVTKHGAFMPTLKKRRSIDRIPILGKSSSLLLHLLHLALSQLHRDLSYIAFRHLHISTLSVGHCTPKPVRDKVRHTIKIEQMNVWLHSKRQKNQRIFAFLFSSINSCMTWISVCISRIEMPEVFIPVCRLSMLCLKKMWKICSNGASYVSTG